MNTMLMHTNDPQDYLRTLQPMGGIAEVKDITDAVLYLADAGQVSGEVLESLAGVFRDSSGLGPVALAGE